MRNRTRRFHGWLFLLAILVESYALTLGLHAADGHAPADVALSARVLGGTLSIFLVGGIVPLLLLLGLLLTGRFRGRVVPFALFAWMGLSGLFGALLIGAMLGHH